MIKELAQLVNSLPTEFKSLGAKPKEGLHILLQVQKDGQIAIAKTAFTRKKNIAEAEAGFLKHCQTLAQLSWMIDTNKCIDTITRAIHSCNPYCLAIKRDNLAGGKNYENRKKQAKALVYGSLDYYFQKTEKLLQTEEEVTTAQPFITAVNNEEKIHQWLQSIPEYEQVKDNEYVVFYFDVDVQAYADAYQGYFTDERVFSKGVPVAVGDEKYGMSGFFNGFPDKKPFLSHQTAAFDISGRISSSDARALFELKDILDRKVLPNPLPIFVYKDELEEDALALFKQTAAEGGKAGYKEIIETLYKKHQNDLGNYYLLFYQRGEIKDFDFVSKFEYELRDENDDPWSIEDFFSANNRSKIQNVFDLQFAVLLPIFNNALIVKTKAGGFQYRYFDEIDAAYCQSDTTYLLVLTYRKAFYDYIYKTKRQAVTQQTFDTVLQASVLDDVRLDEHKNRQHSQEQNIRQKLNIWFSLSEKFNLKHKSKETMASKLQAHRAFIRALAKGEASIQTDDEYAFAVGQVVRYLLYKSNIADRSFKRLEPFLQQVHAKELNKAIVRLFDSYKHETFSNNFRTPFAEVMDYETDANMRNFMPAMLAGIFSKNELFSDREITNVDAAVLDNDVSIN